MEDIETLRRKVRDAEQELQRLREELQRAETKKKSNARAGEMPAADAPSWKWPLYPTEYERYARQLIIPQVGVQGQIRLRNASVLVVGAGGLGSPAAAYIAGAGVGTIGLADGDIVEMSNLHRQIAHSTEKVGMLKVDSAISFLQSLNPTIKYRAHREHITPQTAGAIISQYDLVLDCTDHPTSRYLLSDACVLYGKPLVFASALQTHGQLMVMNCPAKPRGDRSGGPCYRCVFPRPSPPDTIVSCGEGGILGPVVGVMGILQALEAIKIIAGGRLELGNEAGEAVPASMLLFSGHVTGGTPPFRTVRMAGRRKNCFACGEAAELTRESLESGSVDYVRFCGVTPTLHILQREERVTPSEYERLTQCATGRVQHLLLDVREKEHFEVANLDGAVNVPYSAFTRKMETGAAEPEWMPGDLPSMAPIYVVCRQGQDSQVVARKLKDMGLDRRGERFIGDIAGGLRAWRDQVDSTFPLT